MARRSFLAEFNRAIKASAREAERSHRQREREHAAAQRAAEQRKKQEARLRQQTAKATAAERKRLEREEAASHLEGRMAEVADLNAELEQVYAELDGLLAATLAVDDYLDLATLKQAVNHPPFDRADLERPIPKPVRPKPPVKPTLNLPPLPTGLRGLFGKKQHEKQVSEVRQKHKVDVAKWQETLKRIESEHHAALDAHVLAEERRFEELATNKARYAKECETREAKIAEQNTMVDKLTADLGYGVPEAVEEYVSIVMSNSAYPAHFPVNTDFQFDPANAELRIRAVIPGPDKIPSLKSYKYTKSTDEITETQLSKKACKDRYCSLVHQVAIRTLHEVFEADRRGIIQSISLEVGTETIHPATGLTTYLPFVAVASDKDTFVDFDLSSVIPIATLGHLGAAVSKNPYELVTIETTGVRKA